MNSERISEINGNIRIYDNRVAERDVAELLKENYRLQKRVDELETHLTTTIEMKTR